MDNIDNHIWVRKLVAKRNGSTSVVGKVTQRLDDNLNGDFFIVRDLIKMLNYLS